jgi:hypothetical protein
MHTLSKYFLNYINYVFIYKNIYIYTLKVPRYILFENSTSLKTNSMEKLKEKHKRVEFLRSVSTNLSRSRICTTHKQELTYIHLEDGFLLCHLCCYHQKVPNEMIILIQEYAKCLLSMLDTSSLKAMDFFSAKESITILLNDIDLFRENYKRHILQMSERFITLVQDYQEKALREIDSMINEEIIHIRSSESMISTLEAYSKKDGSEFQSPEEIVGVYKLTQELITEKFNCYYVDQKIIEDMENYSFRYETIISDCLTSAYKICQEFLKKKEPYIKISDKPRISFPADKGKIMMDPAGSGSSNGRDSKKDSKIRNEDSRSEVSNRIYFYKRSSLEIYESLNDLMQGNCKESIVFDKVFYGTQPCIYKQCLYGCRVSDVAEITKFNLETKKAELTAVIDDAVSDNTLTDWGGVNNIIFCAERNGIYAVYKLKGSANEICIADVCEKTLALKNKWKIRLEEGLTALTSIFLINHEFYWFKGSDKSPVNINWKFAPLENKLVKIDLTFCNTGGQDYSLHYNVSSKELWTINNGRFYIYSIEFA